METETNKCPTCSTDLPAPRFWRGNTAVCGPCFQTKTAAQFDEAGVR